MVRDVVFVVAAMLAMVLVMVVLNTLGVAHIILWNSGPACTVCGPLSS
jgi:hypothetical protein